MRCYICQAASPFDDLPAQSRVDIKNLLFNISILWLNKILKNTVGQ